jgi:hypothetical protein
MKVIWSFNNYVVDIQQDTVLVICRSHIVYLVYFCQ